MLELKKTSREKIFVCSGYIRQAAKREAYPWGEVNNIVRANARCAKGVGFNIALQAGNDGCPIRVCAKSVNGCG